jgi:hypothetical protein
MVEESHTEDYWEFGWVIGTGQETRVLYTIGD